MKIVNQKLLTGERALFKSRDLEVVNSVFADGESPLKESRNIKVKDSIFKWKYPLWYCENVSVNNCTLLETARSGIWYTNNIDVTDSTIDAPKTFRRGRNINLRNITMVNAEETLWNCIDVNIDNVTAKGNYFAMNSSDITINNFSLSGNYCFDGGKNIEVHNSKLISKDAFWNCENVVVYDSIIIGEYLGWNSKNIKFVNCLIESNQGMCYMDNLSLENCKVINTDLAFEYSTVNADVITVIDSIKNPLGGKVTAEGVKEIILDDDEVDHSKTEIITEGSGSDEI